MFPEELTSDRVRPWLPPADATVPWFFRVTLNDTFCPAEGLEGEVATEETTRSELSTGRTTREVGRV